MIPEWAPNLHPIVVHFPIALLVAALLVDILSLIWRKSLTVTALVLYVLGALGAAGGYLSGRAAADTVMVSGSANVVLATHADWATVVLWFFAAYALIRLILAWMMHRRYSLGLHVVMMLIAGAGLFVLYKTADNGARLVYEHGVGVKAMEEVTAELESAQRALTRLRGGSELPVVEDNGSWSWNPGPQVSEVFSDGFEWLTDSLEVLAYQDTAAVFTASNTAGLFVLPRNLESVQVDLEMGLEDFEGSVQIVYNLADALNYCFTELAEGRVRQGCVQEGTISILYDQPYEPQRWGRYRAVSDQTHFRAYSGGELIAHEHADAPPPGFVGLRIRGNGTVVVAWMEVQSLR